MFHRQKIEPEKDNQSQPEQNMSTTGDANENGQGPANVNSYQAQPGQVQSTNTEQDYQQQSQTEPQAHYGEQPETATNQRNQATSRLGGLGMPGYGMGKTGGGKPEQKRYGNMGGGPGGSNDRRLVVGQGISLSGEIEACDHLMVEGRVEAALKGANVLEIAETGNFLGSVEIEEATIGGSFEGELIVHGRLTILSTGIVTGSIAYKELAIEAGAQVEGNVVPITSQGVPKISFKSYKDDNEQEQTGMQKSSSKKSEKKAAGSELPLSGEAVEPAE